MFASAGNSIAEQITTATPWAGDPGVARSTQQIMHAQNRMEQSASVSDSHAEHIQAAPWLRRGDRSGLANHPDAMPVSQYDCRGWAVSCQPSAVSGQRSSLHFAQVDPDPFSPLQAPLVPGLGFTAATYDDSGFFPPSPAIDVGPTQLLLAINGRIRVFDKTTGTQGSLDASLSAFFDSVRDGWAVIGPRVRYDRHTQRWFVLATTSAGDTIQGPNRILLAVSDGAEIALSTVWTFFYFRQDEVTPPGDSQCIADFPTLGMDANALYIGANEVCGVDTPGHYQGSVAFVVRKSSVLGGGPIVVSAFRNLTGTFNGPGPYTPQGVDNFDAGATEGYIVAVDNSLFGMLVVRRISDPAGTPSISDNLFVSVPTTVLPVDVPHLGNNAGPNGYLDSIDDRLAASHIRGGRLYTVHAVGVNSSGVCVPGQTPSRVGVRWYELQDLDTAPVLARSGTIYDSAVSNPLSYWMPSMISSVEDRLALGFSVAGSASYADAATTSVLSTGSVLPLSRFTQAAHAYNPAGDPGGLYGRRWGAYSDSCTDPTDDTILWTVQQYTAGPDTWGVRVQQMLSSPPVLDPVTYDACSGPAIQMLTLTGAHFYDLGPGASRPDVQISGPGVTVLEVSLLDSTHVSVTLTVESNLLWSTRDITYTNPDGQSVTLGDGLIIRGGRTDLNGDCRVDQEDLLVFIACTTGPGIAYDIADPRAECDLVPTSSNHLPPDLDDDDDVDMADFAIFQRCYTAPDEFIRDEVECVWGIE